MHNRIKSQGALVCTNVQFCIVHPVCTQKYVFTVNGNIYLQHFSFGAFDYWVKLRGDLQKKTVFFGNLGGVYPHRCTYFNYCFNY